MPHDPLSELAIAPPPGSAEEAAAGLPDAEQRALLLESRRVELFDKSRQFVPHDMLAASSYSSMSPDALRRLAHERDVPLIRRWTETDLRRLMIYMDALDVQAGRVPPPVEEPPPRVSSPKIAAKVPGLPMSPSGQWRVLERKERVSLPGGQYVVPKGDIVTLANQGAELIASMAAQGVKFEAYPTGLERNTCAECETSWAAALGSSCPVCFMRAAQFEAEGHVEDAGRAAHAAEVRERQAVARAEDAEQRAHAAEDRVRERELTITELNDELAGVRGELAREREDRARDRPAPEPMPAPEPTPADGPPAGPSTTIADAAVEGPSSSSRRGRGR